MFRWMFYTENESEEEKSSGDSIIKVNQRSTLRETEIKCYVKALTSLMAWTFPIWKKHQKATLQSSNGRLKTISRMTRTEKLRNRTKGDLVILSKFHYKTMILSQLSDEKTCKKLNSNPEHVIVKTNKKL